MMSLRGRWRQYGMSSVYLAVPFFCHFFAVIFFDGARYLSAMDHSNISSVPPDELPEKLGRGSGWIGCRLLERHVLKSLLRR